MPLIPLTPAVGVAILAAAMTPGARAQASACLADADTGTLYVLSLKLMYRVADSAASVSQGLPYAAPDDVAPVTSPATCRKALDVYNATNLFSGKSVRKAVYVISIGKSGYAVIDPANTRSGRVLIYLFDAKWKFTHALLD